MSDASRADAAGEIDALKWYVWVMVGASVLAAGFVWYLQRQTAELTKDLNAARKSLPELAEGKHEIQAMLSVYKKNKEDEARDQPLTWFQSCWKSKGILDTNVQLDQWKVPPDVGKDGKFLEEKIGITFLNKSPLRRDQIAQLLHEIELRSTRLRILTLNVKRTGRDDTLSEDSWSGKCEIGYRYPKVSD